MNDELIYALDVGTRKVMGLVARRGPAGLEIVACDTAEHATRAMSAGEVRDVRAVSELIKSQVERLSAKVGSPLKRAAVAVAGRDLRTTRGRAVVVLPQPGPLEPEHVRRAVLEAVQDALARLPRGQNGTLASHYCVGYAATRLLVDGDPISDPVGHYAAQLEAEVLATTLPRRVLDGLASALERAGLEPSAITLEPIAALQAAVPDDLRRIHLALVDVGAGTSDVAVVKDGEIQAFGMVPCAGDHVTEALADHAALDFFTAEAAKRELAAGREVRVNDVFDRPRLLTPAETLPRVSGAVRELAAKIAECVRGLGGTPRLVLCVGGGSLTPGLEEAIAAELGLSIDRVGRRRASAAGLPESVSGPQAATPLGIAMVAAAERGLRLRRLKLAGRPFFALEIGRPVTVLDALTAAGVSSRDVHGKLGMAVTYELNGELRTSRGGFGRPSRVECGGEPISLDAPMPEGGELTFTPAEAGRDARPTLAQVFAEAGLERRMTVLGKAVTIHPIALVNGAPAELSAQIPDRAKVVWERWPSLHEIVDELDVIHDGLFVCGGRPFPLHETPAEWSVIEAAPLAPAPHHPPAPAATQTPAQAPAPSAGGSFVTAPAPRPASASFGVVVNGRRVEIDRPVPIGFAPETPVLMVDLLPRLGGAIQASAGRRIRMLIDGEPAGYTTPLRDGAEVTIRFD